MTSTSDTKKITLKSLEKEFNEHVSEMEETMITIKNDIGTITTTQVANAEEVEESISRIETRLMERDEELSEDIRTHGLSISELRTQMEKNVFPRMALAESSVARVDMNRKILEDDFKRTSTALGILCGVAMGLAIVMFAITMWVVS